MGVPASFGAAPSKHIKAVGPHAGVCNELAPDGAEQGDTP